MYLKPYIRKNRFKEISISSIFKHIDAKEDKIEVLKKKMPEGLY